MKSVVEEFEPDESENDGDAVSEEVESVDEVTQQEVELSETHERQDVAGEHEERARRDSENCGNRVERKDCGIE